MILTVTLNAALDVTYQVPDVDWDGVNRVSAVHRRAGGKGVNVARVLQALGQEVLVTGLAGGPTGQAIEADLRAAGLPSALVEVAADARTTLVVSETSNDDGTRRAALFNEPGPEVTEQELRNFTKKYEALLAQAQVVVLSGSLPRGLPSDTYATLAAIAAEHRVPAIVDADGEPLRHAPRGRPAIVKPNADELARAVPGGTPAEGAERLRAQGAGSVVVSLGAEGLLAVTPEGTFRARMPYRVDGNPTGAGDSLVAGLALGLVESAAWPDRLRRAAALGAAAVAAPVAGDFDRDVYADTHAQIVIT
ncbi:1-phosphofructokinase family hexose kinase [Nonomuraea cavernae]|uniref:Sugar kinase n=1 Tax=Nonomuraea cavernae TaxID=2045107 RepID=A0A918DN86_9ACTN|nr:1-phosphofructokinase family hexose kinase [Nonomuraea cavernae]MCA2188632.1 1-phosphofructokinase family hexose kinase [Nonomuraea cavernae]GGO74460.1 sugar kinase [Nonomuraea cavernae]